MGFCRRCGDIVTATRCQCGGTSVAPVVAWNHSSPSINDQDRWSKTYVSSQAALQSPPDSSSGSAASPATPLPTSNTRRFPRPLSSAPLKSLNNGVSDRIRLVTSQAPRPPSPLKLSTTLPDTENDILPSFLPHEPSLSKVYGSLLQPKDTLTMHSCAHCSTIFSPDTTIYPDPSQENSFLCRSCFTISGGSKGSCPSCSRPILALVTEGGFVYSGGKYWHKRCYNCASCFRNIGDAPMVDLYGKPSCTDCFDNCLKRDPSTPKKGKMSSNDSPSGSNLGGLNINYGRKSRENSPAIEELEQRLGLAKSREISPVVADTTWKPSASPGLPLDRHTLRNGAPNSKRQDIFGETSLNTSHNPSAQSPSLSVATASLTRLLDSRSRRSNSLSPTVHTNISSSLPNKISKVDINSSDSTRPSASPSMTKSANFSNASSVSGIASSSSGLAITTMSVCVKCTKPILSARESGQFVSVPGQDENAVPQVYHSECFKCAVCDKPFSDSKKGQVSFVKTDTGPCHLQCAPADNVVIRRSVTKTSDSLNPAGPSKISPQAASTQFSNVAPTPNSTRLHDTTFQPISKAAFPRFGGQSTCPGCQRSVSLMERGVVPGPQGTRWHAMCLVCGGKKETTRTVLLGRGREEKKPGCGKKLDSAAKSDGDGGVWCRDCLLLLGVGGSPQVSPTRSPLLSPSSTNVASQFTASTTISRQFTNTGGSETILRQLSGGGLSPTRSISPTKQVGTMGTGGRSMRPRPKSVIGMKSVVNVDEGRGMYLVRQFTGTSGGTE